MFTDHPGCKNTILTLSNMESLSGVVLEIICASTEENHKTASVVKQDLLCSIFSSGRWLQKFTGILVQNSFFSRCAEKYRYSTNSIKSRSSH